MANCVLVPSKITAMDVDAYNERGVYTSAINNGTPLVVGNLSATNGQGEVFDVTPASEIRGRAMVSIFTRSCNNC